TVVISGGEHACVYNAAKHLKETGTDTVILPLLNNGSVDLDALKDLLSIKAQHISLISIMHVSNETGAINDLQKISDLIKQYNPKIIFHSDGVQAFCKTESVSKYV